MADSSGNSRTGSYQAGAKLKAVGLTDDRATNTAVRFAGDGNGKVGLPPAGAVWNSNTWTFCAAVRCWGFEDGGGAIWCADTNGVFDTPAIRFESGSGNSYRVTIALRWGGLPNAATLDISDTHLWHFVVCRVNILTSGSIRIDGADVTPGSWTNQAYTFSGSPTPRIGDASTRVVMQYSAFWPSYLSNANCQTLEAAFNAENTVRAPSTSTVYIGTHTNLDDQADSGVRHNQTRVLVRDGGNVTRGDFLVDQWNTGSGTYDFSRADDVFADCATKGLRVWVLAHGSAGYMNSNAGRFAVPGTGLDASFTTWLGLQQTAWEAFATRYKPGGAGNPTGFAPIYEWWNEPNSASEWKTQNGVAFADATQWARYCKTMRNAVAAIDNQALHVTGGINSWYAPGGNDLQGESFLRTAIGTGDLSGFTNFGIHPYPGSGASPDTNANYDNSYNDYLVFVDVLNELVGSTAQGWITEIGWNASVSQADQDTKTRVAFLRWRDRWRSYGPTFIYWPDWSAGSDGLYTTMPNTGADPTARTAAGTFSRGMRSLTVGEHAGAAYL